MSQIDHIRIPVQVFKLGLRGIYELSVFSLIYNFGANGLMLSNEQLAALLDTSSRTVERAVSRLRKMQMIVDKDGRRNRRCLVVSPDTMSVLMDGIEHDSAPTSQPVSPDTMSVLLPDMTAGLSRHDVGIVTRHDSRLNPT